jgi:hypothetical protein
MRRITTNSRLYGARMTTRGIWDVETVVGQDVSEGLTMRCHCKGFRSAAGKRIGFFLLRPESLWPSRSLDPQLDTRHTTHDIRVPRCKMYDVVRYVFPQNERNLRRLARLGILGPGWWEKIPRIVKRVVRRFVQYIVAGRNL